MTIEQTFTMIKPDGVMRGLTGKIIDRFECCGLRILDMRMVQPTTELAEAHYAEHKGKPFYPPLINLLLSGPVLVLALEGAHAIEVVRKMVGDTEPRAAQPGTIRGDFCHMGYGRSSEKNGVIFNLIHASDSPESAKRELDLWFGGETFIDYERHDAYCF